MALPARKVFCGLLLSGSIAASSAQDMAACLIGIEKNYAEIRACFVEQGRPLVQDSLEDPQVVAAAVDGACQAPQARLARKLMGCMTPDQALDVVHKYAASMRAAIVTATVQRRATH